MEVIESEKPFQLIKAKRSRMAKCCLEKLVLDRASFFQNNSYFLRGNIVREAPTVEIY
jgi:hypothetical protein